MDVLSDKYKSPDDNPTIGIILCTDKDETVVKYSVLKENKQLFASKYKLYLPTEQELIEEIEREKAMIVRERGERYGYGEKPRRATREIGRQNARRVSPNGRRD